ncbi:MAG: hypothetical protein OEN23_16435 [Paracoccaceae bacterium]|nr:hypothetical protein [Paracoccaceae bacterium]
MRGERYKIGARVMATAVLVTLGLAGCGGGDDEAEQAVEQATEAARFAPVDKVLNVEIGRTRNGFLINATGLAPGLGYGAPELRARREGRPGPDGFIDYDFVAQAPDPRRNLGQGEVAARRITAGLPVQSEALRGATGIRVHGLSGGVMMQF